jgi:hypothetical protein
MNEKEKAQELFYKFLYSDRLQAKQCALTAVKEILKIEILFRTKLSAKFETYNMESSVEFWENVEKEIENL